MSHKKGPLSRRQFLEQMSLGLSLPLYSPLLLSLLSRSAEAQMAAPPLRFVFIMNRNGQKEDTYYPNLPGDQQAPNLFAARLGDIVGDISPVFASFGSLKNKISILRGLDSTHITDHSRTSFLVGVSQRDNKEGNLPIFGASADWIIEKSPLFYPQTPLKRALRFSINAGRGFSFSNVGGNISELSYVNTDRALFSEAFTGVSGQPTPGLDLNQRKLAVSDWMINSLTRLKSNSRLGSMDKQRLQQHLDTIHSLKQSLGSPIKPAGCSVPTVNYFTSGQQRRRIYANVSDIIVSAFVCDLTRIACVYVEDFHDTNTDYSYFHGLSHSSPASAADTATWTSHSRWIADRVAELVTKLDGTLDADGSRMLDNTVVVWGNEISNYWHRGESLPTMVAGGGRGKLRMGQYIDYRTRPFRYYANRSDFPAVGRPYTQFLASLMRAAGLPSSEYEIYGHNGKFGEFTRQTFDNKEYDPYIATRTDPLPFFYLG